MPNSTRSAECRNVQPEIAAEERGDEVTAAADFRFSGNQFIQGITGKRHDDRHIDAVDAERHDAAVAEHKRLNQQRRTDGNGRGPRTEQNGDQHGTDRVGGAAAGYRHVKHHGKKCKRRAEGKLGNIFLCKLSFYLVK